jgi:hypothetical protein
MKSWPSTNAVLNAKQALNAGLARKGLVTPSWLASLDVKVSDYRPIALTLLQRQHVTNGFYRVVLDLLRHGGYSSVRTNLAYPISAATDMPVNFAHKSVARVGATR